MIGTHPSAKETKIPAFNGTNIKSHREVRRAKGEKKKQVEED